MQKQARVTAFSAIAALTSVSSAQTAPTTLPTNRLDALSLWAFRMKERMGEAGVSSVNDAAGHFEKRLALPTLLAHALASFRAADAWVNVVLVGTQAMRAARDGSLSIDGVLDWVIRPLFPQLSDFWPAPSQHLRTYVSSLPPEGTRKVFVIDASGKGSWIDARFDPAQQAWKAIPASVTRTAPPQLLWPEPIWTPSLSKEQMVGTYVAEVMGAQLVAVFAPDGTLTTRSAGVNQTGAVKKSIWSIKNGRLEVIADDGKKMPVEAYDGAFIVCGERDEVEPRTNRTVKRRQYVAFVKQAQGDSGASRSRAGIAGVYTGSLADTSICLIMSEQPRVCVVVTLSPYHGENSSLRQVSSWSSTPDGGIATTGGNSDSPTPIFRDGVCVLPVKGGNAKEIVLQKRY